MDKIRQGKTVLLRTAFVASLRHAWRVAGAAAVMACIAVYVAAPPAYAHGGYLLGWYDTESETDNLARFGETHVNIVMPYNAKWYDGARALAYLDEAREHDVSVIVDLYIRPEWDIPFSRLTEIAEAAKDHPALAGYYISDEPRYSLRSAFGDDTEEKVEYVRQIRDAVKEGAPDSDIWLVFANEVEPEYVDFYDNLMLDYYPGWTDPLEDEFHRYVRRSWIRWKDGFEYAKQHGKTFIPVGLAFELPDNPDSPRHLTWEEMRYHFYTGVVADSDGFLFYAYHRATDEYKDMVERLFAKMARVGPAIQRGRMNDPAISVSEDGGNLVYRHGVDPDTGTHALIAVNIARWDAGDNDGRKLENVQFTLPAQEQPDAITVEDKDRSLDVEDGVFADNFEPFAVHVYTWTEDFQD